jgi:hypothetical protein
VPLLIDSGSTGGLTLRVTDPLEWETAPQPVGASAHYRSIHVNQAGRLAGNPRWGPLVLERPTARRVEKKETRLAGYQVMRHATWTFDTRNRRLRVLPVSGEPVISPPERSPGFALRPMAAGFEVIRVFPGTSAERAGIRVGDLVTAVDGTPVHERGCVPVFDDEAEAARVTVQRAGALLEFEIALETLVP